MPVQGFLHHGLEARIAERFFLCHVGPDPREFVRIQRGMQPSVIAAVGIVEEDGAAVHAALDDVQGDAGEFDAG